jgi:hypothetical protein
MLQLTDEDTPVIDGCTARRLPWDERVMLWRMRHLSDIDKGEVLVLDTDVIVQADLRPVFWKPFDVALTRREGPILDPQGIDVAKLMPFNCGVMFSRRRKFFHECAELMEHMPPEIGGWYGDQLAVKHFAPRYETLVLECDVYNYTPSTAAEDVSSRKAVHYKGKRKQWMVDKWQSQTTPH